MNKILKISLVLGGLGAVFFSLTHAASAGEKLTGNEIKEHVIGKWFRYSGGNLAGRIKYDNFGAVNIRTSSHRSDSGSWKIKGDRLCTKLRYARSNAEQCFSIKRNSSGNYSTSHGFSLKR